jgi:hypothetical protein
MLCRKYAFPYLYPAFQGTIKKEPEKKRFKEKNALVRGTRRWVGFCLTKLVLQKNKPKNRLNL